MLDTPIYISFGILFLVLVLAAEYLYQRRQKKQRN
jgi:preprotein translocase subunit YajC